MEINVAKIAVSSAIYSIDKPYSYLIPKDLCDKIEIGQRVLVPFSIGNKKAEGMVLKLEYEENTKGFKNIYKILDEVPLFDEKMLKLALFMQKRYFATFYEVIKIMLPSGFWFNSDDKYILNDKKTKQEIEEIAKQDDVYKEILSIITTSGSIHEKVIKEKDYLKQIKILLQHEIINVVTNSKKKITDKTEKFYFLNKNIENIYDLANKGSKKEVRLQVAELLNQESKLSFGEINYLTGATKVVLNTMVKQNILEEADEQVYRENQVDYTIKDVQNKLSLEQKQVFDRINANFQKDESSIDLLWGVTGSGKTQVYIELLKQCQKDSKGAIVLIPEIALTTQLLSKFTEVFGHKVAILHSKLTAANRVDEWKKISDGVCDIVIGTRSAVFAPVKNLGMIIIDEEHEKTYKSENNPRYDALDIAKYRTYQNNSLLLLSSATPSIESFYSAKNGDINLHTLKNRYGNAKMPEIFVYDMKETMKKGIETSIGDLLYNEMIYNLNNLEQTILFLNRRGNSKQFICLECGYVPECINCSTNMTYHSTNERIMCHLCGYSYTKPDLCPKCNSRHVKTDVFGTQKLEMEVKELFPTAKVLRLDADTNRKADNNILSDFKSRKADILIGTQMVTKGLDFENATLVGVIDADMALFADDYRSREATFSQITQVIGRAGRHKKRGRAVIQTLNPDNDVINFAKNGNYEDFYYDEIARRHALKLPPINDIFCFVLSSEVEHTVVKSSVALADRIKGISKHFGLDMFVLGPVAAKILKINKKYRYVITIRMKNDKEKRKFISGILKEFYKDKKNKGVNLYVDLNGEC